MLCKNDNNNNTTTNNNNTTTTTTNNNNHIHDNRGWEERSPSHCLYRDCHESEGLYIMWHTFLPFIS